MQEFVPFNYKRAENIAKRTKELYEGKKGKVQIHIGCSAWRSTQTLPPLNSLEFPNDMEVYLDMIAIRDCQLAAQHDRLNDDFIPSTYPYYGIAEHSAFVGGVVDFSTDTSYHHQVCEDISDFRKLNLDSDNMWTYLLAGGMEYMREKWGK